MRQLHLFRGKRQRGSEPPTPKEYELHCQLAELLRRWCHPSWRWTHMPLGEKRDMLTAVRLKRMGVNAGWPDFQFVGPGRVLFIELKREGGALSEAQADIAQHIIKSGHGYLCTDSLDDALGVLRDLGIVRVSIGV